MAKVETHYEKIDRKYEIDEYIKLIDYEVGSQQLLIFYNGVICLRGDKNQYVEYGAPGDTSNVIKMKFSLNIGDELTAIVIS
jgi:hypothetical protein